MIELVMGYAVGSLIAFVSISFARVDTVRHIATKLSREEWMKLYDEAKQ
jgi:hypothetical protein